ncbi:hypothetical protein Tco_1308084 [Tanacetum coccineum]
MDFLKSLIDFMETTTCSLFSPESILTGEKILCAHAAVYPVGDGLIHGKKLRKGHMRVSVFKVLNRQEELKLPVPDEDIPNLGGALSAFIQWPIGAIACFSGLPNTPATSAVDRSTLPTNVQGPSTECSTLTTVSSITQASKKRKKTIKATVEQSEVEKEKADIIKQLHLLKDDLDQRPEAVKTGYYRWTAREDCTMPQLVDFKKEIFRDAYDFTLPINTTDIIELLAGEKLGTNILTLFSSWQQRQHQQREARKEMVPKVIELYSFCILDCFSYFEVGVDLYLYICNGAA